MKYKISIIGFIIALTFSLVPVNVFAAGATVYVSPSISSVTKGNNVTVSVRVNSGSAFMDSAQASISFDSTKLQYVSYSVGSFTTTVQGGVSGSTFTYAGALLGGSVSSDRLIFSVTFKSLAAGSASLSLSGVRVAYQGDDLSPISTSGGTITINNPVVVSDDTNEPTVTPTPTPTPVTDPVKDKDVTAPKIVTKPTVSVTKNTINLKFKTNEKSKIQVKYTLGKDVKTISDNALKTDFNLTIGTDQPLQSGITYKVEIIATDGAGNKATINSQNIRTTGVDYSVTITDLDGRPLANHAVQLFSDPMSATTDQNGVANFSDVTPGEHTLVFDIDGLVLRQPVTVGSLLTAGVDNESDSEDTVTGSLKLPVKFAGVEVDNQSGTMNYVWLAVAAAVFGAVFVTIVRLAPVRRVFGWIYRKTIGLFRVIIKKKNNP